MVRCWHQYLRKVADATQVAPVALLTEAGRQAFFGLILGLAYPVLRARHGPNRALAPLGARRAEQLQVKMMSTST